MFHPLSTFTLAAALFVSTGAQAQDGFPAGVWSDSAREVTVRFAPCTAGGQVFCGTTLSDTRPDPDSNPAGYVIVRDLRQERGVWRGVAVDGTFRLNLTLRPSGPDTMVARYCFGPVCESETWTRVRTAPQTR
jgi:uncharacterized protein (DUF2147 family)